MGANRGSGTESRKLTAGWIAKAEPNTDGSERWVWDEEVKGLALRIRASGHKAFYLRYRTLVKRVRNGQDITGWAQKWVKVGSWGKQTLDDSRKKAVILLGQIQEAKDPSAEKKQRKDEKKSEWTFKEAAERFIQDHGPKIKESTRKEYERQLKKILYPVLAERPVKGIAFSDLEHIHQGLAPVMSNRVHATLSVIFANCERWKLIPHGSNPTHGHEKHREQSRDRFLAPSELQKIGVVLDALEDDKDRVIATAALAIKALMFTGMRVGEVLGLQWEWIDSEAGLIRLPDSKGGAATVDINPFLKDVFDAAAKKQRLGNPYVFQGRKGKGNLVGLRRIWIRVLQEAGIIAKESESAEPTGKRRVAKGNADRAMLPIRLHDLRRTFGTIGVSDANLSTRQVGGVLRHKTTAAMEVYARLAGEARKEANEKIAEAMAKRLGKTTAS